MTKIRQGICVIKRPKCGLGNNVPVPMQDKSL
ncbi:hypothetical protein PMEL1_00333 [Prevotella melaninogenica]|uniref:Uncharacterized protein n=1 Tax=Prevotella melaninogenica TaxID=28132 RepID=A0A250KFP0_9BACT|nr:hypothetical protein PMEL1_00333 [Prevotella melaninogenica]